MSDLLNPNFCGGAIAVADYPDCDAFTKVKNDRFQATLASQNEVELELIEVKRLLDPESSDGETNRREGFSLLFEVHGSTPELAQGTYRLEHQTLGAWDFFLVPVGPRQLEAVFN